MRWIQKNCLYIFPLVLVLPALLFQLGSLPLLADEPTRALVALEMLISKNYIVPTINGDFYYNKPPLYNWMLAGLYQFTGHINEWVIRIPTVIFILLFGATVYFFIQKYVNRKIAFIVMLAYITSGRVLFYDSFLGLIDTMFSAFVFLNFMLVYHFGQKKQYHFLFIITYLITAILYMLKGLPGLAFQGITLFVFFVFIKRDFKILFSPYHFLGIFIFSSLISIYYIQYLKYNNLEIIFKTIVSESTKRTIAENGILDSIKHILFFPVTTVLHFLPWTIPFSLIFSNANFRRVLSHPFLKYCFFILVSNISVYWLSPETVPRYLFMFLPLIFAISFFLYFDEANNTFKVIFEKGLLVVAVLLFLVFMVVPFVPSIPEVPYKYLKLFFLIIALSGFVIYYYKSTTGKIFIFCSILLLSRIGFDWFVFPSRIQSDPESVYKNSGIEIGRITKGKPLYIYKYGPIDRVISFYITRERNELLKNSFSEVLPNTYYITSIFTKKLSKDKVDICYEFYTSFEGTKLYLVKLKD